MARINELVFSQSLDSIEQGNHAVQVGEWEGVASHVVNEEGLVEGVVVWVPSATIGELQS